MRWKIPIGNNRMNAFSETTKTIIFRNNENTIGIFSLLCLLVVGNMGSKRALTEMQNAFQVCFLCYHFLLPIDVFLFINEI